MKPRAIVLFSSDEKLQHAVMTAATTNRRSLRLASTVQHTLEVLQSGLDDVDMIILDVDSKICGIMLLNALGFCCERIPVVTVTDFERDYALPHALSKGAVACLGKPVTAEEIIALIGRYCSRSEADKRCGEERLDEITFSNS